MADDVATVPDAVAAGDATKQKPWEQFDQKKPWELFTKAPDEIKTATTPARSDIPQMSAYKPTIGQRTADVFRSLRTSQPVESILGKTPEETAQMLQPRPTGLLPNIVKAAKDIPKVAELSPGDLFPEQTTLLDAAGKELLSQVNLENLAMLTGIGEVWKAAKLAKDTPKLATLSKAMIGAYFATQGAKGGAEIAGQLAGAPSTPAEKGKGIAGIGLNALMTFLPTGEAILSGKIKPFQEPPTSGRVLETKQPAGAIPPQVPTSGGIPFKGIPDELLQEKPAKPVVPATPAESYETGDAAVRRANARTKEQIQQLFPKAALTREQAAKIRDRVWGQQPTTGEKNAEAIRGDQGQLRTPGQVAETSQEARGHDVEQKPPGQPQPVVAGETTPQEAQAGQVSLTPEEKEQKFQQLRANPTLADMPDAMIRELMDAKDEKEMSNVFRFWLKLNKELVDAVNKDGWESLDASEVENLSIGQKAVYDEWVKAGKPKKRGEAQAGSVSLTAVPAIKTGDTITTGTHHVDAYQRARDAGIADTSGSQEGFLDNGVFKTREQYAADHPEVPTTVEQGKTHSEDLAKPPMTEPPAAPEASPAPPSAAVSKFGGAIETRTPEEQAKSKKASMDMAAAMKADLMKATKPQPDWRVVVQQPQVEGEKPFVQIVDPRQPENARSPTVETLRKIGHDIPDFTKLPAGSYSWKEASDKLSSPSALPSENAPTGAGQPASIAGEQIPAPGAAASPTIKSPLSAFGKQFYKNTAGEWRQKGKPSEKVNASRVAALEQLLKPKEPAMAEVGPGLGAAKAGEPPYQPLSQLTDSLSVLANKSPKTDSIKQVFDLGKAASGVKNRAIAALDGLKAVGSYMKQKAIGYPVWNSWKAAIGDRHLALTQSVKNAEEFVRESQKTVPNKLTQEAISDYIDAGGKDDLLKTAEAETKPEFKEGYAKARNLSPDEKALAENAKTYFDQRLQDAIENGILEDGIEDYIHRIYPAESPLKSALLSELRSGIFTGRPALAKQRVYQYDYEAEKAGLKPVKSFIKRIAAYDLSLNKAIADRQAVKAMTQIKMADGRPMVDVGGIGTKIEGTPEKAGATLIRPSAKTSRPDDPKNDRGDFRSRDYPALKRWKWVSKDGDGNPVFVQGDVLIHPDAVGQVDRLFKRSAIRQNPVGRAALATSSTIKQTMLDLSGFHPVQITVHGWEHRTFKPVDKIDFDNADVRGLVRGGLVVGETTGHELFSEGVSGGGASLTRHIPVVGEKLQAYNHWLFNDYIPRLKVSTGLHALERNRSRFPNMPPDDLYHLTANQMNNAFGELNYDMIGRSKTTQDVMRLALLAPDFLEARAGFAAQAATKYGKEQKSALLLGAATLYITARIINKLLDGEYHFEPNNAFSVVVNKRAYSLRTVQGDVLKAATEPGKFIYSRLNPTYGRTLMEFFSGRDYFGRQRSGLQQLKDFASNVVPISFRGLLNPREQNLMESFLNAFGITNRRSTAADDVFQLADNFKKAHNIPTEPGQFMYDPEKDPYRPIKEAAIFSDAKATAKEIQRAIKAGHPADAVWKHFTSYSERPFTGSKKNDETFYKELSADNKKIFNDAVKERKMMIEKFRLAWELAGQKGQSVPAWQQPPP